VAVLLCLAGQLVYLVCCVAGGKGAVVMAGSFRVRTRRPIGIPPPVLHGLIKLD
jgi:hypothetical protein